MLRRVRGGCAAAVGLVFATGAELVPCSDGIARRALTLMGKYADVPMDFVDAVLVAVAEERGIRRVLTLDRRGFLTYRAKGRERFELLL